MLLAELPQPGYTIREAESILGLTDKYLYRLIKEGKLQGYVDSVGQHRISKEELYAYAKSRK